MTSIFKRDGRPGYTLQWLEGGRKRQKQFRRKGKAEEESLRLQARILGAAGLKPDVSLTAYARGWLERCEPHLRPSSFEHYTWAFEQHILPALGQLPLRRITRATVREFLVQKLREPRRRPAADSSRKPLPSEPLAALSRTTVGHIRAALHACLAEAVDDEILQSNPAAIRRRGRAERLAPSRAERQARVKAMTAEQLRAFLDASAAEKHHVLFRTMAGTGLRPGEALGLEWEDVDLVGRQIHVRRTWSHGRLAATKTGFTRTVDLSRHLVAALRAYDVATKAAALKAGEPRPEVLFPNDVGKRQDDRQLLRVFKRVLRRAELPPHLTPHGLRHTFASLLLQRGEPIQFVQRMLGHATISMTVDTYGSWLPTGGTESVDRLDDGLFGRVEVSNLSAVPENSTR